MTVVNAGGALSIGANGGIDGGAIVLAADGAFTNNAGASALSPTSGNVFTIYSQVAGNATGSLPGDNFGGLIGANYYNDAYNFSARTFATAAPSSINQFVFGYAAT